MPDKIRRIETEEDFQGVSALYKYRKGARELKWLFTDPENNNIYNAFVAENDKNKIVGVIGYVSSVYVQGEKELTGVIFMSWIISPNAFGMTGVLLLKKVLMLGDFGFAYGGSEVAQNLYKIFKYKHQSDIIQYYKILNLKKYYHSLKSKHLMRRIGIIGYLLPSYFQNGFQNNSINDIELIPYDGNNYMEAQKFDEIFEKKINKNYIDWLLDCPTIESYAFNIRDGKSHLGMCVLYTQKDLESTKGRIVHLPFLGSDIQKYMSVIEKCLIFFKAKGCCSVSVLEHHDMMHLGFKKKGFISIRKLKKSLYLRDNKHKLTFLDIDNWNLQYSEGDQAYRDF